MLWYLLIVICAFVGGVMLGDTRTERKYMEMMRNDNRRMQRHLEQQYRLGYSEGLKDATLEQKGDYNG